MPDELPAVTVPSLLKAGCSFASRSIVVSGLGCSSRVTELAADAPSIGTATSSSANASRCVAALHFI
jgi:hypothetical protein